MERLFVREKLFIKMFRKNTVSLQKHNSFSRTAMKLEPNYNFKIKTKIPFYLFVMKKNTQRCNTSHPIYPQYAI